MKFQRPSSPPFLSTSKKLKIETVFPQLPLCVGKGPASAASKAEPAVDNHRQSQITGARNMRNRNQPMTGKVLLYFL